MGHLLGNLAARGEMEERVCAPHSTSKAELFAPLSGELYYLCLLNSQDHSKPPRDPHSSRSITEDQRDVKSVQEWEKSSLALVVVGAPWSLLRDSDSFNPVTAVNVDRVPYLQSDWPNEAISLKPFPVNAR